MSGTEAALVLAHDQAIGLQSFYLTRHSSEIYNVNSTFLVYFRQKSFIYWTFIFATMREPPAM